mgnify:CR=1 FL=1
MNKPEPRMNPVDHPVHPLIAQRWSPVSFRDDAVAEEDLARERNIDRIRFGLTEVVLSPHTTLVGKTLRELHFPSTELTLATARRRLEYEELFVLQTALALFLATFWDAITDPVMGYVSDNFRSRYGRRRPFIVAGALLGPAETVG